MLLLCSSDIQLYIIQDAFSENIDSNWQHPGSCTMAQKEETLINSTYYPGRKEAKAEAIPLKSTLCNTTQLNYDILHLREAPIIPLYCSSSTQPAALRGSCGEAAKENDAITLHKQQPCRCAPHHHHRQHSPSVAEYK